MIEVVNFITEALSKSEKRVEWNRGDRNIVKLPYKIAQIE